MDGWIREALKDENGELQENWVLVGGPPCQAYSVVGRSRRGGISSDDPRVYLYREYYRILAKHNPPIFVMENVKGLLSAQVDESPMFEQILRDIRDPAKAYSKLNGQDPEVLDCPGYDTYSFVTEPRPDDELFDSDNPNFHHSDYIIKSEKYGIPQARHRVIVLGIRKGIDFKPEILKKEREVFVEEVIKEMPAIRSSLSKKKDSTENWANEILKLKKEIKFEKITHDSSQFQFDNIISPKIFKKRAFEIKTYFVLDSIKHEYPAVAQRLLHALDKIKESPPETRGGEFVEADCEINSKDNELRNWYLDKRISGVCNHTARGHMSSDLHRYLSLSVFGEVEERSPKLEDFPEALLPNHVNVYEGVRNSKFADRFRVQLWNEQAKTITSHISKDGHYYIHPDPDQCRSLTVREAARLQTFSDNYFFCGPRTSQYIQVGNAVPPLLAKKIAIIVHNVLQKNSVKSSTKGITSTISTQK
ncbi:MAG: DNA cytosine methyltransferase [Balneolaceae bacterium]|nr:DNA cytosine methyltransferase [Balneolaceae bacterium]